ncbi:DUF2752 domain-containing protein [bacterium]|nr:DUF2752 domain-containing protein [bacterium]
MAYQPLAYRLLAVCLPLGLLSFSFLPESFWSDLPFELCLFRLIFHHDCLGCGTLRGLSHLFHGHFQAAWQSNPLVYFWLIIGVGTEIYLINRSYQLAKDVHD